MAKSKNPVGEKTPWSEKKYNASMLWVGCLQSSPIASLKPYQVENLVGKNYNLEGKKSTTHPNVRQYEGR